MFFGLVILPSLGLAVVATLPFTQVNNYQNQVKNVHESDEIKTLCNNIQDFSLKNLGVAYLFDIDEASGEVVPASYEKFLRSVDHKTSSKPIAENYCGCLADGSVKIGEISYPRDACSNIRDNSARILTKMAENIKQKMQDIQKDTIRNNCNYYNGESVYKAFSEEELKIQSCHASGSATINCSSLIGDSRCLMTQQILCNDGQTYVYQTCNRPKLVNGSNGSKGKLMVEQSTDVCGDIDNNTAVKIEGTTGYPLNYYDMDCVLKEKK